MKTLITESSGKVCSKRVMSLIFGATAVAGFFLQHDPYLVGLFLAASMGKSFMTLKKYEE